MRISDWSSDVCSSDLKASTVSGDLSVKAPAYKTSLNSVSGDLTAIGVPGAITADTVSGDLSLDGGALKTLKLQSVSGDLPLRSEEHTSELLSLMRTSYAVSCLKTKHADNTSRRHTHS